MNASEIIDRALNAVTPVTRGYTPDVTVLPEQNQRGYTGYTGYTENKGKVYPHAVTPPAAGAMRVYKLVVAMGEGEPPCRLTMLAPGTDLAEARRVADIKFPGRVLELAEAAGRGA